MFLEDSKNNLTVQRRTSGPIPEVPFAAIKNHVLGKKYELSLLFPDLETARRLHKTYKNKNTPVNILSFPLDDQSGEIIISLAQARKEASKYGYTYIEYLAFLFIHGLVHLQGFDHGDEMEEIERKIRKKFNIPTV